MRARVFLQGGLPQKDQAGSQERRQIAGMDIRLGEFEQLVLLALLNLGDQGHAPALQITLGRVGRRVALGSICKALHRLESKGLIRGRWGNPQRMQGGRRKRAYQATAEGLEALRVALAAQRGLYGRTPEHQFVGAVERRHGRLVSSSLRTAYQWQGHSYAPPGRVPRPVPAANHPTGPARSVW